MNSSSFCLNQTVGIIFGVLFLLTAAHAASFDCRKATSGCEQLICDDQELSKSDQALAALYAKTLKQAPDPLLVMRQQRVWLRDLPDRCIDVSCLRDACATRIKELSSVLKTMSRGTAKMVKSDVEVCRVVADFASSGILGNLSVVPPEESQPAMEELERIFGKDTLDTLRGGSYWRLDLNSDGIPDHLFIDVYGTAHVSDGLVLSGKKGSVAQEVSDDECYDLSVLKVGTRYYVLCDDAGRLCKLWRLSGGGKFMPVCKFTQREEPMCELVAGKENAVCSEVRLGRIHHVEYALSHELVPVPTGGHNPMDGLAQADIDNDGRPDNVVRILFTSRGCSGAYIAVTDDARTNIPNTKLNGLLSDKALCGTHMDVFVHEGITYVDVQDDWGDRQIYRITGGKVETLCEFRSHFLYDVVDVVEESEE